MHRLIQVKDATEAVRLVRDGQIDLRTGGVLAETTPPVEMCNQPDRAGLVSDCRLQRYHGVPGLVVLSDNWYPGWRANVDGATAKIFKVNSAIRAAARKGWD